MQAQPSGWSRGPLRDSLWTQRSSASEYYGALVGSCSADVAIVGAGVAGASTALHLASAGLKVVVLEAKQPGAGAAGQSGGLIAPNFVGLTPERAEALYGLEAGGRLTGLVAKSAAGAFDIVRDLDIACEARQEGFWTPAHTPELAGEQRAQVAQWRARGYDVTFVDEADTRAALGSHRYCGAMRFAEGGQLNPLALVQGLVRRAVERGAVVFGDSPVQQVRRLKGLWEISTASGKLSAPRVVFAANAGNSRLHPKLRRTTLPLHVMEFATTPLDARQRETVLPQGGSFTDRQSYLFTARYDEEGRLISAFPLSAPLQGRSAYDREARLRLKRHFPKLGAVQIGHMWTGMARLNTSFLPSVYDLEDGAYAIQACNGRGLAINVALGREVATVLATGDVGELSRPLETPKPIRMHTVAQFAPYAMMSMAYLHSRLLKRIPPGDARG